MEPIFLGLNAKDLTTIVGGLFTLWFSVKAYTRAGNAEKRAEAAEVRAQRSETRAIENEAKTLELSIAAERSTILAEIRSVVTASERRRFKIFQLRVDADEAGLTSVVRQADEMRQNEERYMQPITEFEQLVSTIDPAKATHDDLVMLRGRIRTTVKADLENEKLAADQTDALLAKARRSFSSAA